MPNETVRIVLPYPVFKTIEELKAHYLDYFKKLAKGNGGTRKRTANTNKNQTIEGFINALGLKYSTDSPNSGVLGELTGKGEIKLSDKTKEELQKALAKSGTGEELTQDEADALHTILHEIGHYSATRERGMDTQGGVFFGSGIDKVSEVMNNIWTDGHLGSWASKYGMTIPKNYIPKDDAYRRLQGKLDRVMDILGVDRRAVYADIVADKVSYTDTYLGGKRSGKNQDHRGLAAVIARNSGGRVSEKVARDIIDNVAANSRDNEYQPKDRHYSGKKAAQIINDNKLAKHKVYDYMFIARSDFDNRDKAIGRKFTPTQIKNYYNF